MDKIIAFFSSLIILFLSFFGIGGYSMDYDLMKNVKYGNGERQVLDIAFPKDAEGDIDLILYIHGGGWIAGEKDVYFESITGRAKQGYVSAAVNYRYVSENSDCVNMIDDINSALIKIRKLGAEKGVNIERVLLTGHSAGAHLSLLYAYTRAKEAPIKPVAVVEKSGPTDLVPYDGSEFYLNAKNEVLKEVFFKTFSDMIKKNITPDNYNDEEIIKALKKVSPLYYVDENSVPTVICHGSKDSIVPYDNAVSLDRALTENGVEHIFITYPNSDHGLESDNDCNEEAERVTEEYIKKYLKKAGN